MTKKDLVNLDGILLVNKERGISSNRCLQQLKRLFCAKKVGHTGTLDPLATGLLILCFGKETKNSSKFLEADKEYVVKIKLGITTTTFDSEGDVVETKAVPQLSTIHLESALQKFIGHIEQIPPMYSSLRHNGQRLYKLARRGIEVERPARQVTVYSIDLLTFDLDELSLCIRCSKGTYIRTLVHDLGATLGCGAHVIALERTAIGNFKLINAVNYAGVQELLQAENSSQVFARLANIFV